MSADVILEVRCPAEVVETLQAAGLDRETLSREAREGLAARLYASQQLSLGKAAELAALPVVEFMDLLRSLRMPVAYLGDDQLADDLATADVIQSSYSRAR